MDKENGEPASDQALDRSAPEVGRKRPYHTPEIVDFGNVRALTRGGGTMGTEPMTGQKRTAG